MFSQCNEITIKLDAYYGYYCFNLVSIKNWKELNRIMRKKTYALEFWIDKFNDQMFIYSNILLLFAFWRSCFLTKQKYCILAKCQVVINKKAIDEIERKSCGQIDGTMIHWLFQKWYTNKLIWTFWSPLSSHHLNRSSINFQIPSQTPSN